MERIIKDNREVCSRCGKTFDSAVEGFVHRDNGQRRCASCFGKTHTTTTVISTICNILVLPMAAILVFSGIFAYYNGDLDGTAACFIFAVPLIVWRILASVINRSKLAKWERIEVREEYVPISWKCSHCGANTEGETCEYCDSPYEGK